MKWKNRRRSTNVDDRRGQRVTGGARGAGMGGIILSLLLRGGMKTRLLVIGGVLAAMLFFNVSPQTLLSGGGGSTQQQVTQVSPTPNDEMGVFLSTMKADNEDVWSQIFQSYGREFLPSKLVIYNEKTVMPGGLADSRMGPFYLSANKTIYIDPHFFTELKERFGAPGDFAQAYVVAHEIAHHVQEQLGYLDRVHSQRGKVSKTEYNRLTVRLELQADFLAGVFAHHANQAFQFLETGDIKEAMDCARAIGDDTLQRGAGRKVVPDSFTHGTSEQRARWFNKGYKTGRLEDGDTFGIPYTQL